MSPSQRGPKCARQSAGDMGMYPNGPSVPPTRLAASYRRRLRSAAHAMFSGVFGKPPLSVNPKTGSESGSGGPAPFSGRPLIA